MNDRPEFEGPLSAHRPGDLKEVQDWVVVPFPGCSVPQAAGGAGSVRGEARQSEIEIARLFNHLSILSNYCYGQGHRALYEKFEVLALELAQALLDDAQRSVGGDDGEGAL